MPGWDPGDVSFAEVGRAGASHVEVGPVIAQPAAEQPRAIGGRLGENGTKWNRRRRAASASAIVRSAVFIVPMIQSVLRQSRIAPVRSTEESSTRVVFEEEVAAPQRPSRCCLDSISSMSRMYDMFSDPSRLGSAIRRSGHDCELEAGGRSS